MQSRYMCQASVQRQNAWLHMVYGETPTGNPHQVGLPQGRGVGRCSRRQGTPRQTAGRAAPGTPSAGSGPPSCSSAGHPASSAKLVSARPDSACSTGLSWQCQASDMLTVALETCDTIQKMYHREVASAVHAAKESDANNNLGMYKLFALVSAALSRPSQPLRHFRPMPRRHHSDHLIGH